MSEKCTFCDMEVESVTTSSDGTTKACGDCYQEGEFDG